MMINYTFLNRVSLVILSTSMVILSATVLLPVSAHAAGSQVQSDQSQWLHQMHGRRGYYGDRYRQQPYNHYYRPNRHWAPPPPRYWNRGYGRGYWRGYGRNRYWAPRYRKYWRPYQPGYYRPHGSITIEGYW